MLKALGLCFITAVFIFGFYATFSVYGQTRYTQGLRDYENYVRQLMACQKQGTTVPKGDTEELLLDISGTD